MISMTGSRQYLCRTVSFRDALLQASATLVALALGSTGAPSPAGSLDRAAPSGKLSIPRNVLPLTGRDAPSIATGARGDGASSSAAAAIAAADDFLTFCVDFNELPEQLVESLDYRVVAVTGCQCSGKSTLLNALFGTG